MASGVLAKILVFRNGIQVGFGYFITSAQGRVYNPILINNEGTEELPNGEYNLLPTGEEHLVVLTWTKQ